MNTYPSLPKRPVVLVTESRAECRTLIKSILEAQGYEVLMTRSSVEGLVQALEFPGEIGWLITNSLHHRYHNGIEMAACFRVLWPKAEVIFLGPPPGREEEEALRESVGKFRFVRDPLAPDDLMGLLGPKPEWCRAETSARMV